MTAAEATTLQEIMDMAVKLDRREQFYDDQRKLDHRASRQTPINRNQLISERTKDRSPRQREQGQPVSDNPCRICLRRNPLSKQIWSTEHMESHRKEEQPPRPSSRPLLLNNINTEIEDDILMEMEEETRDREQSAFEVEEHTAEKQVYFGRTYGPGN